MVGKNVHSNLKKNNIDKKYPFPNGEKKMSKAKLQQLIEKEIDAQSIL